MIFRILASLIVLFSLLFLPFWISIILVIIGMIYFSLYFEGVLLFFLSDLIYGTKEVKLFNMYFISFFIALVTFIAIEILKEKIRISK